VGAEVIKRYLIRLETDAEAYAPVCYMIGGVGLVIDGESDIGVFDKCRMDVLYLGTIHPSWRTVLEREEVGP
jgi:hypothetical protein